MTLAVTTHHGLKQENIKQVSCTVIRDGKTRHYNFFVIKLFAQFVH